MSARLYKQVLEAVKSRVTTLLASSGWSVVLLTRPEYSPSHAPLPCAVVAPPAGLAERIVEETFDNRAHLAFEVYVGTFTDDRAHDNEQLFRRTDAREDVRLDLWRPRALGLDVSLGEYQVGYDPSGEGGAPPPPNVVGSWQLFWFVLDTKRSAS